MSPDKYNFRQIPVKGHYQTYHKGHYPGPYKKVRKYVKKYHRTIKQLRFIPQPFALKEGMQYPQTMIKEIPDNLIKGIIALAKDQDHEYSIDIDFERKLREPEQMLVMKGGPTSTIKAGDFEMFGHTHPNQSNPRPSRADIMNMEPLRPQFIVGQKTGKTIIMNLEDINRYRKWHMEGSPSLRYCDTEYERKLFFNQTGVRIYPMVKNLKIELKDDHHPEKIFPRTKAYSWSVSKTVLWPEDNDKK